jgi:hypothetical protein
LTGDTLLLQAIGGALSVMPPTSQDLEAEGKQGHTHQLQWKDASTKDYRYCGREAVVEIMSALLEETSKERIAEVEGGVRKTLQLSIDDCAPAIVQRVVHKVNSIYGPERGSSAQATMSPTKDMVDDENSAPVVSTAQQAAAAAVDASLQPSAMKVDELRTELMRIELDTSGLKAVLAKRLQEAIAASTGEGDSMEIEPAAAMAAPMRFGVNPLRVGHSYKQVCVYERSNKSDISLSLTFHALAHHRAATSNEEINRLRAQHAGNIVRKVWLWGSQA